MLFEGKKVIISDWSGVISDDREVVYTANCGMIEEFGMPKPSFDEWLAGTVGSAYEYYAKHGILLEPEEIYDHYERHFVAACTNGCAPRIYDDAATFLKAADAYAYVTVISSHPQRFLAHEAEEYGVRRNINTLIGSVVDKASAISSFLNEYDYSRSEAIYVGDMVSDVRAAQKAGIDIIALTRGYHTREMLEQSNPTHLVDTLRDVRVHLI